jgi:shikimate dehydrogenase
MLPSVGLIGDPVAHSVSPAMHNAAFAAFGIDEEYVLWHTPAPTLPERIAQVRAPGMRGANVTVPHKTAVMRLLDSVNAHAQAIGAVNTIVRDAAGRLHGVNTDAPGFARALTYAGFMARGGSVVVLGAGGTARAIVYALVESGIGSVVVANRTAARAHALVQDMQPRSSVPLHALALDDAVLDTALAHADLLVNTTTVGLDGAASPLAPERLHAGLFVVDAIYRHTPLLRVAAARGARVQNGLEMLVQQGALAWEAWMGRAAPVDSMRAAAQHALEQR